MAEIPVTVVVPVRNEAASIAAVLAGLRRQTAVPAEIIFCDGGSDDGTPQRIADWWALHGGAATRLRILDNQGRTPGAGRNLGAAAAASPWVAFIDAGIVPADDWLEQLYGLAVREDLPLAFGVCDFSADGLVPRAVCALSYGLGATHAVVPASIYSRQSLERIGRFREDLLAGEDLLWFRRCDEVFGQRKICPEARVSYRHFPPTFAAAFAKWFRAEGHVYRAGVRRPQELALLVGLPCLIALAILLPPFGAVPLLAYFGMRGLYLPFRRCREAGWWRPLPALPTTLSLAVVMDVARWLGVAHAMIRPGFPTGGSAGTSGKPRVCFVVTSPFALNAFLVPHLRELSTGYDITVCVPAKDMNVSPDVPDGVHLTPVAIRRRISPLADLKCLFGLYRYFRHQRFDLVFGLTPKAGLLAMLAALAAGIPSRVHCFTGQVWATKTGFQRWLLKSVDRLMAACATRVLADSRSQMAYLIHAGVVGGHKISVLADGSMAGVNLARFRPDDSSRTIIRREFGIPDAAVCLLYVGRLKREKGIPELVAAFRRLQATHPSLHLLLVGPDDDDLSASLDGLPNCHRQGYVRDVERYMAASDVLCLPSHREGFGLVLIEAGAVGLPVVASNIYGITDAVADGESGLLHEPGDIDDLVGRLDELLGDHALRQRLGAGGRRRAASMYAQVRVTQAMAAFLAAAIRGETYSAEAAIER